MMTHNSTAVASLKQTILALLLLFVLPPITNAEVLTAEIAQSLIDENGHAEIPNTYTSIGYYAFENATSLTSIVIPDSVTSIVNGAFYGAASLQSIVIPDSVTAIGESAAGRPPSQIKRHGTLFYVNLQEPCLSVTPLPVSFGIGHGS